MNVEVIVVLLLVLDVPAVVVLAELAAGPKIPCPASGPNRNLQDMTVFDVSYEMASG